MQRRRKNPVDLKTTGFFFFVPDKTEVMKFLLVVLVLHWVLSQLRKRMKASE
jgi:hypothetical protein